MKRSVADKLEELKTSAIKSNRDLQANSVFVVHHRKLQKAIKSWTDFRNERITAVFGKEKFLERQNLKDQIKTLYHPGQYGAILMVHILSEKQVFSKVFFTIAGRRTVYYTYLDQRSDEFEAEKVLFQLI